MAPAQRLAPTDNPATEFRSPEPSDAAAIWRLVRDSGSLDLNSPYAYLLACRHHGATSLIVTDDGEPVGFVVAYRPPEQQDTVFVWQIAVSPLRRGRGLGRHMLHALLERLVPEGVRYLEATVTPSNTASDRLFRGVATDFGVDCDESLCFAADEFPEGAAHEEELLYRIGPLAATTD